MPDHRAEIVKRVMRSLEETTDPDRLVTEYFDAEHGESVIATVVHDRDSQVVTRRVTRRRSER